MALLKWTSGDTITARSANNKGIRKGTECEIGCIASADNEAGDILYNTCSGFHQTQAGGGACDFRGNLTTGPLVADCSQVTVCGNTPTEVKNFSYIKDPCGFNGNQLTIVATLKTDNAGSCAHMRIRTCGSCCDDLDLTTTSVTCVVVTGIIDITGKSDGIRTLEVFLDDGPCDIVTQTLFEVYGI